MTRAHKHLIRIVTLCAGLAPALVLAHPAHGEHLSFVTGALHPLTGADHLAGFIIVGLLAAQLAGRTFWAMTATFMGLLVAAWTTNSDGWHYAAGFMLSGASLVAAGVAATRFFTFATIAAAPRSPT